MTPEEVKKRVRESERLVKESVIIVDNAMKAIAEKQRQIFRML